MKTVLDAKHPNLNIDQSSESWLLEPVATQLARPNKKTNLQLILCMHCCNYHPKNSFSNYKTRTDEVHRTNELLFYFKNKLHGNMNPLYDLLLYDSKFHWNYELEILFQQIKSSITKDVTLNLPNAKHQFFITVDSSSIGIECVLV